MTVLFTGALLSYPVYLLLSPFFEIRFYKLVSHTTVFCGLLFGVLYLKLSHLSLAALGFNVRRGDWLPGLLSAFAAGALILVVIEASLYVLGMRLPDPDMGAGLVPFLIIALKALLSGFVVGLIEETIFRGAIFSGLARQINITAALLLSSLVYAAVHFIKYPALPANTDVGWFTGLWILVNGLHRFSDPVTVDSFITLFILGILLGMVRWRTGNITQCIGLHAGIVCAYKITSYLSDYRPGSSFGYLVNNYDHTTGYLASIWLCVAVIFYYVVAFKQIQPGSNNHEQNKIRELDGS